jgi:putative membrane protein
MARRSWQQEGQDPDYRFTLANERTFLAWIRTSLALLAGGVLLHQFATALEPRIVLVVVAVGLGAVSTVLSVIAYTRWRSNEIAMRHGRPLPYGWALPVLAATSLATAAVLTVVLIVS